MQKTILFRTDRYHKEVFGICLKDKEFYFNARGLSTIAIQDAPEMIRSSYAANAKDYKELLELIRITFPDTEFTVKRTLSIKDLY